MQFRKIGVHEVVKDKEMGDGLQHKDGLGIWKEKGSNYDAKGSLCSGKCHDMCSEELVPSSVQ